MLRALEELSELPEIGVGVEDEGAALVKEFLFRFGYSSRVTQPGSVMDEETILDVNKYQRFFGLAIESFVSRETLLSMATPRCGRSDFINASRGDARPGRVAKESGRHWELCNVPFSLVSPPSGITKTQALDVLRVAFGIWHDRANLGFIFREAGRGSAAQVLIDWISAAAAPGLNLVVKEILGYGDPPPVGGGKTPGTVARMLFDGNLDWSVNDDKRSFHMLTVVLHEVGHILGLEHCGGDSVMNPNIGRGRGRVDLRQVDIDGATALYNQVVCEDS
jgi:hypothetical protein